MRRQLGWLALLAAAWFFSVFPTLRWVQFSGDSEDNVVQTVLEMRQGGPWWVPTLGGEPRLRKPPLTAWITAAAVSPATVQALDSADPLTRDAAYQSLAVQMRWPSLLAGALLLVGAGVFGRLMIGPTGGFLSLLIAASTLLVLRFTRVATTDVWLALWVTIVNIGFATALLEGRRWLGFCTAGVAMGLALLSKGPVAPLQTVLPAAVYAIAQWRIDRRLSAPPAQRPKRSLWLPLITGLLLTLAIAAPWWISTYLGHPEMSATLKREFAGDAGPTHADPVYAYLVLLPLHVSPWLPLFIAGVYIGCQLAQRNRRILFTLCLIGVPLVVMTLHLDRKDRYLLPLIAPLATLTAVAALEVMKSPHARDKGEQIVRITHWAARRFCGRYPYRRFHAAQATGRYAVASTADGAGGGGGWGGDPGCRRRALSPLPGVAGCDRGGGHALDQCPLHPRLERERRRSK